MEPLERHTFVASYNVDGTRADSNRARLQCVCACSEVPVDVSKKLN